MTPNPLRLLPALALAACALAAPAPRRVAPPITAANAARVAELASIDRNVWRIAWRPDGQEVAFVVWEQPVEVRAGDDLRVLRQDPAGRKVIHFAHGGRDTVAFCENDTLVEVRNLRTKVSVRFDAGASQPGMTFSPDGKLLATGGYGDEARVWNAATGQLVRSLPVGPTKGGLTITFSRDGKVVAVGNRNSTTHLFEAATGKLLHVLDKRMSHELRFNPDGKTLAVAYVDGSVRLWEVATGKLLREARPQSKELYTLDWSPCGEVLATAGREADLVLWDRKLAVLKTLAAPSWVIAVRFSPDGTRLLSSGGSHIRDRKVRVWGVQ